MPAKGNKAKGVPATGKNAKGKKRGPAKGKYAEGKKRGPVTQGYKKPGKIKGVREVWPGRWRGQLKVEGHMYMTTVSATQLEAALAYNRLCEDHKLPGRCNLPEAISALITMAKSGKVI